MMVCENEGEWNFGSLHHDKHNEKRPKRFNESLSDKQPRCF
jgi:hypothetical protein